MAQNQSPHNGDSQRLTQFSTVTCSQRQGNSTKYGGTHSYRTQFMKRLVDFSQESGITIKLAYYPPYHSKYNPVERCWGILENHWNGSILDSIEAVVGCASSTTWKGRPPVVKLIDTIYEKGVTLGKKAMLAVEEKIQRLTSLPRWFVTIQPEPG